MGKTSPSSVGGVDSIPGQGVGIQHASWPKKQKYKTEAIIVTDLIKTLKKWSKRKIDHTHRSGNCQCV